MIRNDPPLLHLGRLAFLALAWLAVSATQAQTLGTSTLVVGSAAGTNSVVLFVTGAWTNSANTNWLHLSSANQSGTGSTNVVFNYDANSGATRSGSITIAGQTLTVTQAGATYIAAGALTTLASSNLNQPYGVAVDGSGNVYIADTYHSAVKEWTPGASNLVTLPPSGLFDPVGVAVDGAGNLYIADTGNNAIKKWSVAGGLTTLVSNGLSYPYGLAVDSSSNVYIADTFNNAIRKWSASNSSVTTLVSSDEGLSSPSGVAVDSAGNVYIADSDNNAIKKWSAANSNVTTLVSANLNEPSGVAVDGAGNVFIADTDNSAIKKWSAANKTVTTLASNGLSFPSGVAVDGTGNVYIADTSDNAIKELPYVFVDVTNIFVSGAAGNDVLPVVLPTTENLLAPFTPTSDTSWLTINGANNGVVDFSFAATGSPRTAAITVFGQSSYVTQQVIGSPPTLIIAQMLGQGVFQFAFTNNPNATFTVLSSTNLSLPLSAWTTVVDPMTNTAGLYQFTSQKTTNEAQVFYVVRSP